MKELLEYHIQNTERQLGLLQLELKEINQKIESLHEFKTRSIVTARWVSLIVSAASGLCTMVATALISFFIQRNHS